MRRAPIALTVALAPALAWGCQGDDSAFRTLVPDRVGTAELPFDARGLIALLADETTACVAEDYEYLVHCFDRGGEVVGVFGGEGEGPGEFDMTNVLVGGHDGTVGVLDFGLNRFSVFEPSGALVTEMLLPGAAAADFIPVWRFGASVVGVAITTFDFALFEAGAGSGGFMSMFEIDIASGTVVRQEELPPVDAEIECEKVHYGFPDPGGGWVFTACGDMSSSWRATERRRSCERRPSRRSCRRSATSRTGRRETGPVDERAPIRTTKPGTSSGTRPGSITSRGARRSTTRADSGSPPSGTGTNSPGWTSTRRARGRSSAASGYGIESWDSMWRIRPWRPGGTGADAGRPGRDSRPRD